MIDPVLIVKNAAVALVHELRAEVAELERKCDRAWEIRDSARAQCLHFLFRAHGAEGKLAQHAAFLDQVIEELAAVHCEVRRDLVLRRLEYARSKL